MLIFCKFNNNNVYNRFQYQFLIFLLSKYLNRINKNRIIIVFDIYLISNIKTRSKLILIKYILGLF